jgi:predicted nucleotidyltransferase
MGTIHARRRPSLFPRTRGALLALLYGRADQTFYTRQLVREMGAGHGAVQRELKHLDEMGLIVRTTRGNQTLYRANSHSPVFSEIKSLIAKTVGLHDVIGSALGSLGSQIQLAFIYGSVARQEETVSSDVDLMIVGKASFSEVVSVLGPAQKTLGREINPSVFPPVEFRSKLTAGSHFLHRVMKGKKLFVVGTEHELAELAAKRLARSARDKR